MNIFFIDVFLQTNEGENNLTTYENYQYDSREFDKTNFVESENIVRGASSEDSLITNEQLAISFFSEFDKRRNKRIQKFRIYFMGIGIENGI